MHVILPVKVQLKFAKVLLGVGKGAVNLAVLSELGLMPIATDALKLSVGYWHHLVNAKVDSLVYFAYKANLKLNNSYASKIKQVFLKSGFQHIWENQNTFSKKRLIFAINKKKL